jgi:hypothetical protein
MCIDYTSLNKECSKDPFPHPRIDQIVYSTSSCGTMLPRCLFWFSLNTYVYMSHGLKNTLPTFVRAMHKTFVDLIRDLIEVYVNGIIVKIKSHSSLLDKLAIVFDRLHSTCRMLNPDKCVFGVSAGKLHGFLVSHWGIEANPEKIKVIEDMWLPAHIKVVQKLMGCLVALNQFISRLAEQALPFFNLLWKFRPFVWTQEADEAF